MKVVVVAHFVEFAATAGVALVQLGALAGDKAVTWFSVTSEEREKMLL